MVALFTFINCLSKLLKAKLDNPEGGVTCFPFFVLEDTLEATLHHRVFCDEAEKKHGQIDGQLRNEFQQTQFMSNGGDEDEMAPGNGGDEDQILIQLPPPAVTTNGWVKAIIVADTSIGIMGLTSVDINATWN